MKSFCFNNAISFFGNLSQPLALRVFLWCSCVRRVWCDWEIALRKLVEIEREMEETAEIMMKIPKEILYIVKS